MQGFLVSDGVDVTSYVCYNVCNAFTLLSQYDALFDNAQLVYGLCGSDDDIPLDVIAHELMHIVTEFAILLCILPDMDGALKEGFSDIFGTVMELVYSASFFGCISCHFEDTFCQ